LSWPKARINIQGGGQTGWTKKINAARRDGRKPAERQNRKPSAPSDRQSPAQARDPDKVRKRHELASRS